MQERVTDMEVYLNKVSNVIKTRAISQEKIDQCKENLEISMKNSTCFLFQDNHFYQELPPNLQRRLVRDVLEKPMNAFAFFFEDFVGKNKAPTDFMVGLLT